MNADRQKYLQQSRLVSPAFAFGVALMQRLPQEYESKVIALVNAYPQMAEDQLIETYTASLGIIWQCQAKEVPRLLELMTADSKGDITYRLGEPEPALGFPVRIEFNIPEAMEEEK